MKVKKIHIENYRMLKRIDIDLEENLSLIIGKNNCGKTSFLSILNKFIGSQSSTNNFTYNDFNSDFQDSLFDAINDDQLSWEKLNIKGIELYLFIEYDETDNLSNIQPLMLDLDPDNNIVILKFEYTISEQKFIKLISDFNAYCKKFEKEPDYSLSFIGIKTLIITDIDSGKESISKDKNGRDTKKIVACSIEEATHTTNGALLHYFETPLSKSGAKKPIAFFITLAPENKILQKNNGLWETNPNGNLMIAYQTKETGGYYPRSFEDAFFQINRELVIQNKKLFPSLKCKEQLDEKDADGHFIYDSYDLANNCIGSKASFALDILLNSINDGKHTFSNWKMPPYIEEGLLWLRQN